MALFKRKRKAREVPDTAEAPRDTAAEPAVAEQAKGSRVSATQASLAHILIRPRITEKATFASEKGMYVFDVAPSATKQQVAEAVRYYYKVVPRKVNVVKMPKKRIRSRLRGRFGATAGGKKAYVYVREGDSIDVI